MCGFCHPSLSVVWTVSFKLMVNRMERGIKTHTHTHIPAFVCTREAAVATGVRGDVDKGGHTKEV